MENKDPLWVTIRTVLIATGGIAVGLGVANQVDITMLIENADKVFTGVGSLLGIGTWVWQMIVRWRTRAVPIAVALDPTVATVSPVTGAVEPPKLFSAAGLHG